MTAAAIEQVPTMTSNVLLGDILSNLSESKKLTYNDKRWLTEKLTIQMDHERNMKILELLITDQDAFYKLLLLGSAGLVVIGAALATVPTSKITQDVFPEGFSIAGLMLIPAGLTLGTFAAVMLAPRQIFGDDGVQFEVEATADIPFIGGGASGSLKVG